MDDQDVELGPIDVIVIGYPAGAPMTGEAIPLLLDLVDRGIVRVLDALFVQKQADGTFSGFDLSDLDEIVIEAPGVPRESLEVKLEAGLARKTTPRAISSGFAMRPVGFILSDFLNRSGASRSIRCQTPPSK